MTLRSDAAVPLAGHEKDEIQYHPIRPGTDFFGRSGQPSRTTGSTTMTTTANPPTDGAKIRGDDMGVTYGPVTSAGMKSFFSKLHRH